MKIFLKKGVAQTSNIFHINWKKNNHRNDKLAPKAKFKTGMCTSDKNQEKQNFLLIRQHKYLYYESIFSRNTFFFTELTVDFTVLQIFLQVTDMIISKLCMEISNIFLSLEHDRFCLLKLALFGNWRKFLQFLSQNWAGRFKLCPAPLGRRDSGQSSPWVLSHVPHCQKCKGWFLSLSFFPWTPAPSVKKS